VIEVVEFSLILVILMYLAICWLFFEITSFIEKFFLFFFNETQKKGLKCLISIVIFIFAGLFIILHHLHLILAH